MMVLSNVIIVPKSGPTKLWFVFQQKSVIYKQFRNEDIFIGHMSKILNMGFLKRYICWTLVNIPTFKHLVFSWCKYFKVSLAVMKVILFLLTFDFATFIS